MHESLTQSRVSRGPRAQVRPRLTFASDAATFNGTFMRPNSSDDGTIPAAAPFCSSPDIWISGTNPLDPSTLTTTDSYGMASTDNIVLHETNYIYVRGKNGAATTQTNTVQLYYSPSAVIQWPSQWQGNVIETGLGAPSSNIANLAPGAIGAAPDVFQWTNVQPPPSGSDHYCLFAQLNDVNNSNPFPEIGSQVDMAALITNNLGWAWKNTVEVPGATWSLNQMLIIPANGTLQAGTYNIYITSKGFVGWQVSFSCSQLDDKGNVIALAPTTITPDGQLVGVQCYLEPGFNASISLNMTQGSAPAANNGDVVTLNVAYQTNNDEDTQRAIREGLVDWRIQRAFHDGSDSLPIKVWIPQGAQHGVHHQSS